MIALEENLSHAYQTYADWQIDDTLYPHIKAEYPDDFEKFENLYDYINEHPIEFVEKIRILAQRKTFKGKCSTCPAKLSILASGGIYAN